MVRKQAGGGVGQSGGAQAAPQEPSPWDAFDSDDSAAAVANNTPSAEVVATDDKEDDDCEPGEEFDEDEGEDADEWEDEQDDFFDEEEDEEDDDDWDGDDDDSDLEPGEEAIAGSIGDDALPDADDSVTETDDAEPTDSELEQLEELESAAAPEPAHVAVDGPDAVAVEIVDEPGDEPSADAPPAAPEPPANSLYQKKLRDAEQEYSDACLELAELEDTLASTKLEIKAQREVCRALAAKLRTIKRQGEAQLDLSDAPLLQNNQQDATSATDSGRQDGAISSGAGGGEDGPSLPAGQARTTGQTGAAKDSPGTAVSDSWISVPTNSIGLQAIKGMGKKKLETILDACPTLGELEALRATAGLTSLPGVGRAMADAIEDVILAWLSRHRDAQVLEQAAEGQAPVVDDARASQVKQRATELAEAGNLTPKPGFESHFATGRRLYEEGICDLTECPWLPSDQQDAWLMGWLTAQSEVDPQ